MVGVAGAIANAVYHATGKCVRKVPIRIEHVLTGGAKSAFGLGFLRDRKIGRRFLDTFRDGA